MQRVPQINIGLFGLGIVGGAVFDLLHKNAEMIEKKLGYPLRIKKVCDTDPHKAKAKNIPASVFTTKVSDVLDDPEISIIVELIGDRPVAKEIMLKALDLGKHVVTANKAILANSGFEIFTKAAQNERDVLFEAAVAGSIPLLRSIREGFVADDIVSVHGIINGTSNYILTEMGDSGKSFDEVVKEAQAKGYAEANPASDIEGTDTLYKLVLLTGLCFGQWVTPEKIYKEGITQITPLDLEMGKKFGYTIKLLAIAKKTNGDLEARVHPTMVPQNHMLASVKGAFNAVMLEGAHFGKSLLYGLGAGGPPTATAVVADLVELSRHIATQCPGVPPLGYPVDKIQKAKIKPIEDLTSEYYLRFTTVDKPGVLAKVTHLLGEHHIGISSVYQHGREEGASVPIVILTHKALEKNIHMAVRDIDKLSSITEKTVIIRIES